MKQHYSDIRNFIDSTTCLILAACSYTNTGICSVYLTTSGRVCRAEFGFVEDRDCDQTINDEGEEIKELELKTRSFSSVKRLNNYLIKLQQ
jgi:hypothetical protein